MCLPSRVLGFFFRLFVCLTSFSSTSKNEKQVSLRNFAFQECFSLPLPWRPWTLVWALLELTLSPYTGAQSAEVPYWFFSRLPLLICHVTQPPATLVASLPLDVPWTCWCLHTSPSAWEIHGTSLGWLPIPSDSVWCRWGLLSLWRLSSTQWQCQFLPALYSPWHYLKGAALWHQSLDFGMSSESHTLSSSLPSFCRRLGS